MNDADKSSFSQRMASDAAWFEANPENTVRVEVIDNTAAAEFLASRDGHGAPVFPHGSAVIVSFGVFLTDVTKTISHLIVPNAPAGLVEKVEQAGDRDPIGLSLMAQHPGIQEAMQRGRIVFRSERPMLITLDQAA